MTYHGNLPYENGHPMRAGTLLALVTVVSPGHRTILTTCQATQSETGE